MNMITTMLTKAICVSSIVLAGFSASAEPIDASTKERGRAVVDRAIEYLNTQQDPNTGGWGHNPDGPNFPAITGLVINGMLLDPRIDPSNPVVDRGLEYILSFAQMDGSIHDGMLPTYNTAICISALSQARTHRADSALASGIAFLKTVQYHNRNTGGIEAPDFNEPVAEDHPYYGGVGYGKHGRPDLSNLSFFLQAMHDAGVSTEDPAYKRALVFLSRVQMNDETNDMHYADASNQGGFIYATVPNAESIDSIPGQSQAGDMVETSPDGGSITRLRSYGSMTYSGFKSLIYADLSPDDPRITAAWRWIESNYSLEENPGMGDQGYYYFLCAMGRALDSWGADRVGEHDWRADLVDTLEELQQEDGSFAIKHERWMEDNATLITAYALIALQHAIN
jgi:squalene-hopene/tetraprenyl-beta-curcumene cyclase